MQKQYSPLTQASCRFCGAKLLHIFVDLGMSPLCESYISPDRLNQMEPFYPLRAYVCDHCFLVQLEEYVSPAEIFSEYAYFSSYSAPDYLLILPWNLKDEIMEQMSYVGQWGAKFVIPIPEVAVYSSHGRRATNIKLCRISGLISSKHADRRSSNKSTRSK